MKKAFTTITIIALLLSLFIPTAASETKMLSEMSENECIDFVKQYNIKIPDDYSEEIWAPFIKEIIGIVEENPEYEFGFNYTATLEFANAIKAAVNDYYGTSINSNAVQSVSQYATRTSSYALQHSTLVDTWMPIHNMYNCYVYSIEIPDYYYVDPGYWSMQSCDASMTIDEIADLTMDDLFALDHERVYSSRTMDTSNLCTNEKIICVRRGTYDYHFMKLNSGEWYHKPGTSAILKYNHTPSMELIWSDERVLSEGAVGPLRYYDSEIIYISYDGHNWDYVYNSNGTHTKACSICGDVFTSNCEYNYTYIGDDMHNASCKYCSNGYAGAFCSFTTTYNGDGTHTRSCNGCSNTYTDNCNLQYTNITNTRHSVSCAVCDYSISSQSCSVTYTSKGNKTHTVRCTKCNNTYTGNCSITYSYTSSNQHRGSCNKCNYTHTASCYYMTTYCGNSSLGDVHKKQCQTCGHISGSATTACTFVLKSNGNNTHSNTCTQCGHVKSGPTACMFKSDNTCKFCGAMKNSAVINDLEQEETA